MEKRRNETLNPIGCPVPNLKGPTGEENSKGYRRKSIVSFSQGNNSSARLNWAVAGRKSVAEVRSTEYSGPS
jgi:hypothetical protein